MNSHAENQRPKPWLMIVVVFVVLCCCCVALAFAGVVFMRSEGMTFQDLFSAPNQRYPQIDVSEGIPQENPVLEPVQEEPPFNQTDLAPQEEEESIPQAQPVQEETTPPMQTDDFLLVITSSGLWKVDEVTQEVRQISNDVFDAFSTYRKGLSPNKKHYAYISGDTNPTLVVLNLQTNSRVFETSLSGPNSQIKSDMDAGDPGLSVLAAMQTSNSIAWSPDSTHLAFVAAMDNSSTDLYFLNTADLSISQLSDENSNAAYINWSPDGRFIEFVTVNNFGTGAGFDMDAIWVYDRSQGYTKLLEQSTSSGEEFISWIDSESFFINSWSAMCSSFNLRSINAVTGSQDMILESCFSGVAYDPVEKLGIVAVSEFFVDACRCGEVNEFGTFSFGERLGLGDVGIKIKKFEPINAYNVELLDPGNLFALYTDAGLAHLFDTTGFPISIPNAVTGLKPYPSPSGDFWAWYPYYGEYTSLWVTDNQMNSNELSTISTGNVLWSNDGDRLYFVESNRIFYANAPDFTPTLFAEIPDSQIFGIRK